MKTIPFLAIVLLAFAFPAHAQDAMKKDAAVKPADPELKVVLDSWNEVGRKLIAMAEDFPEDKYDFKPTPAQRSSQSSCCTRQDRTTSSPIPSWGRSLRQQKIPSATNTSPRPTSLRSSRNPSPMAQPPSSRKATKA